MVHSLRRKIKLEEIGREFGSICRQLQGYVGLRIRSKSENKKAFIGSVTHDIVKAGKMRDLFPISSW